MWAHPFRSAGVFELNIVRKRCKPVFSIIIRRGGMVGRESGEELRGRAQEVGGGEEVQRREEGLLLARPG